jgi:hypothetical protein
MSTSYQSLVEEIAQIHETALADGDVDWNKAEPRVKNGSGEFPRIAIALPKLEHYF